jgi:hypothetical protein
MNALDPRTCPLCGGDNQCAMASGKAPESCWCVSVEIAPTVLQRLPADAIGKVCICGACVGADREHASAG